MTLKTKAGTPAPATRSVTVPAPEDLELAKDDALLQLRIGRGAHLYAVVLAAAFALDGILLLLFYPNLPSLTTGATGTAAVSESFYLLVPALAGLAVAGVGLYTKWDTYQLWPWELHFSVTFGAVLANAGLVLVYGLRIAGVGPFAALSLMPWFYPVELAAISAAFIGVILTWSDWALRQWVSALAAVLPVAAALLVFFPPSTTTGASSALAVSLFLAAILYLISGSFLHLITSGTRPHERALITSGQSRMFRLADEIRQKEEVVHFREAAVVKRESDVENSLLSIKRQNNALRDGRQQLDDLEEGYRLRSDALVSKERTWAGQIATLDARERLLSDKSKALELREQEVQRLVPQISAREQRLVDQEGQLTVRDVDVSRREQELGPRELSISEAERRAEARRRELDQRTEELLRREGEVAAGAASVAGAVATADLAAREAQLRQLETTLDDQNARLGATARQIAERSKAADASVQRATLREAAAAAREAGVAQREAELADLLVAADARRTEYEGATRDYQSRLASLGSQEAEVARRGADAERATRGLAQREATLSTREEQVRSYTLALDQREGELTARERAIEATEAEVNLRRQEALRGADLPMAGLAAMAYAARLDAPMASAARPAVRTPVTETIEVPPPALPAESTHRSETLTLPANRRFADRLPTGTPRLDDLLLGGLPAGAQAAIVGDTFVGKEVAIYAFLAEGLKRGEPAVIVTASRSPAEISESLGVALPQFREYEQLGMVHWVDASASGPASGPNRIVVNGPGDRAGIANALGAIAKDGAEGENPPPRVAFLGLASTIGHGEEREGLSFLQSVVGTLKTRRSLAMYSLEPGALSEAQVETLLGRMDGAIVFRQDRDRTFLSVKGFGDVQTHDWVECRATQRALIIGSFALERIR